MTLRGLTWAQAYPLLVDGRYTWVRPWPDACAFHWLTKCPNWHAAVYASTQFEVSTNSDFED